MSELKVLICRLSLNSCSQYQRIIERKVNKMRYKIILAFSRVEVRDLSHGTAFHLGGFQSTYEYILLLEFTSLEDTPEVDLLLF